MENYYTYVYFDVQRQEPFYVEKIRQKALGRKQTQKSIDKMVETKRLKKLSMTEGV